MTFAEQLEPAGLSLPEYGGLELGAVLPAALDAIGAGAAVKGRDAARDRAALGLPQVRHVCVVILDGLGQYQLESRRGHARFLRTLSGHVATAGYPTTTAASLALFGTGQTSGMTGMTGYTVRNPRTGQLANMISWDGAFQAEDWQPQPSLLQLADQAGFNVTTLGKAKFAGSGLTHAVLRGGQFIGAEHLVDRIDVALGAMSKPGVSYMYWGEIDAAGHAYGWQSGEWTVALEDADRELERLAKLAPKDTLIVITADHGMIDAKGEPRLDVATDSALGEGVDLLAGEPRALHVYGADPDAIAKRWAERLDGHAVVGTRADAIAAGIFGNVDPALEDRIGDVVVAMRGRSTVVHSGIQSPASIGLVGVHGSLTPEELNIPVLVAGSAA